MKCFSLLSLIFIPSLSLNNFSRCTNAVEREILSSRCCGVVEVLFRSEKEREKVEMKILWKKNGKQKVCFFTKGGKKLREKVSNNFFSLRLNNNPDLPQQ